MQAFYEDLFGGRFNPNGCPIKATFYVSHEWTDYAQVSRVGTCIRLSAKLLYELLCNYVGTVSL